MLRPRCVLRSDDYTFTVTVEDRTKPVLTLPALVCLNATSPRGALASFAPTASDNCSVSDLICVPASGTVLPLGDTVVTCTAIDASGNKSVGKFVVRVKGAEQQLRELMFHVVNLPIATKVRNALVHKIRDSLDKLRRGKVRDASGRLAVLSEELQPRKLKGLAPAEAASLREELARI